MENRSMNDLPRPLNPPDRLLCGPGPSNIDPRVLQAMQLPMLGHLDPEWHRILEDLVELLQLAYRRSDGLTIALSASGTSGMEAGLASLAEPGVTSLGGMELEAERWGVDYCYSCSQKCLGAPPGMSPVSLSPQAMERIRSRTAPVPFSFDFEELEAYWITRPAKYHHTTPNVQY